MVRQKYSTMPSRPYFLAVTRFIPRKNLSRLIDAYALYRQHVTDAWDLVLCGSGVEAASLKQQTHQLELDAWIHFPGFIPTRPSVTGMDSPMRLSTRPYKNSGA